MSWYELGSAQAQALEADAERAWNQAVRADYEQYLIAKASRAAAKRALVNEREQAAMKRMEETRRRWRENPTREDLRSGDALNALAFDLADPKIPPERWRSVAVELPAGVTIESIAFRFADAPKYRVPGQPAPATVALGRMKGEKWPVALRRAELQRERDAYREAVATVLRACAAGKELDAPQVDAVRGSLAALKEKASQVLPTAGGAARLAVASIDRLDEATRIFLDREFAEELIRDAEEHQAKNVAQLLGFMKKYRLLFAEGDDDPEGWAASKTLYDVLKRQKVALDFAAESKGEEGESPPR
jgi:hypothetical protein